jgi:hypothetical protein
VRGLRPPFRKSTSFAHQKVVNEVRANPIDRAQKAHDKWLTIFDYFEQQVTATLASWRQV